MALVDYDSSSSTSEGEEEKQVAERTRAMTPPPAKRQKRLPSLPSSYETAPKDDPTLHQGRTRTRRYVDGEYNTHVYLSLPIPSPLLAELNALLAALPPSSNPVHSLIPNGLHISLTRPIPLRRDQITAFRSALSKQLGNVKGFRLSLAGGLKTYHNEGEGGGHGGRAFLALRVGAGAGELKSILEKTLHPILEVVHLPTYHENPEFHTSVAWTLLGSPGGEKRLGSEEVEAAGDSEQPTLGSTKKSGEEEGMPFSQDVLGKLNSKFENRLLAAQPTGGWDVDCVHLKVAKEVTVIHLST
ncbi:hypothetical protein IAT38_000820 [Cryptococcus sp. DSM 104549]